MSQERIDLVGDLSGLHVADLVAVGIGTPEVLDDGAADEVSGFLG